MLSLWKKRSNETYPFLFFHVCTRPAPSNKHLAPLFPINKANQDCCNRAIENLQNKDCADLCTPIAFLMSRGCEAAGARLRLLVRSDGSSLRIEVAHSYKRNTHKDYKRTHRDVICLDLPTRLCFFLNQLKPTKGDFCVSLLPCGYQNKQHWTTCTTPHLLFSVLGCIETRKPKEQVGCV